MINTLIEGKLVTLIVGSVFRIVEILVRAVHLAVRALRILIQEGVTSRIDRWLSRFGKRMVATRTRVDPTSIVLIERHGEYTGDPKYIAEELLRRGAPYKITWVLRDHSVGPFPREFRFVRHATAGFFRAVAGATVVIQDGRSLQESGAVKGPAQRWLEIGHGTIGTTLGHARNDILLDTSQETADRLRKKVLARLGIADRGQKFLLYDPASGDDTRAAPLSGIDIVAVRAALSTTFGGTWDVVIRTHATSRTQSDLWLAGLPSFCHDASFYPDLQELLVVADAGMTDHSRWIPDYLLTRKPAFLFSPHAAGPAPAGVPLPTATSNQELLSSIAQFDQAAHTRAVEQFLQTSSSIDDGSAASRIVDRIEELMP
ncbi:CDP-glycerol glycerophosphotransferase family protein [Microbacterium terricola]|uniref:CDP-glycerol glycerophosphotransferase n=1 Tax=Microbacterium terricola TaxID=344163 RepID=A0ABM8DWR3_9MICO|nr:CDP-glycerol glycerophosphotransferase family protein [Microbacterium terricola]UYK39238.1 CDP-glycerol glycerophosphotransferase family protein [Microbacterium terricola]BDV30042.1 hypothetical protein Microterr_07020 [Microbacterium terricola]